jgi:hypothetical protein
MFDHGKQDNSRSIIVGRDGLYHCDWQISDHVICIVNIVFFNYIPM